MNTTTTDTTTKTVPTIEATILGSVLTLTFSNGAVITLDADDPVYDKVRKQALMHGFKQKLVDAGAMARNLETGRSATVADKYEAVREVFMRLVDGAWNKPKTEGGGSGTLLARARAVLYPLRDIKVYLSDKTDEQKAALKKNAKVAAAMLALKPEPDTAGIDTEAMLGELE